MYTHFIRKILFNCSEEFDSKVSIAKKICDDPSDSILNQRDVFFQVPIGERIIAFLPLKYYFTMNINMSGRLKMRYENDTKVMLVQYARDDIPGPKLSKVRIVNFSFYSVPMLRTNRSLFLTVQCSRSGARAWQAVG